MKQSKRIFWQILKLKENFSKNATFWRRKTGASWSKKVKETQEISKINQKEKFGGINLQQVWRTMGLWEIFIGTTKNQLLNLHLNTRNKIQVLLVKFLMFRRARTLIYFPNTKLAINWEQIQWLILNNILNMKSSRWCLLSTLRTHRMFSSSPKVSINSQQFLQAHLVKMNNGFSSNVSRPARCLKTSKRW